MSSRATAVGCTAAVAGVLVRGIAVASRLRCGEQHVITMNESTPWVAAAPPDSLPSISTRSGALKRPIVPGQQATVQ